MEYVAGLDVSLEKTAICVVDEAGRIVREVRARAVSEPEALIEFFRASGMQMERIGLEACSPVGVVARRAGAGRTAGDLHRGTSRPRQRWARLPNKTDRNDARGIAQIMRTDGIAPCM